MKGEIIMEEKEEKVEHVVYVESLEEVARYYHDYNVTDMSVYQGVKDVILMKITFFYKEES